jgi:hypothetical protein
MTEADIIEGLKAVLKGEKQRIQRLVEKGCAIHELKQETYRVRHYLRAIHPDADELVDHWIKEAGHERHRAQQGGG